MPDRADTGLDDLFSTVNAPLHRIAHRQLGHEATGHTLGTTGLVHEAWLELAKLDRIRWPSRAYVLASGSRAMRRILIDHAVARRAQKRGGGAIVEALDDADGVAGHSHRSPDAARDRGTMDT
ncbi:MAG TPA: ECF-type sigma factor [Gemmatimonadales bacterium]|nr:ECF-type sigma factor [Gemmatimonadales bacterium]